MSMLTNPISLLLSFYSFPVPHPPAASARDDNFSDVRFFLRSQFSYLVATKTVPEARRLRATDDRNNAAKAETHEHCLVSAEEDVLLKYVALLSSFCLNSN